VTRSTEHFSLGDGSEPEGPQRWEAQLSDTHVETSVRGPEHRAAVRHQWIDDLVLVDCLCESGGTHSRSQFATRSADYVAVLVTVPGRKTVEPDGTRHELGGGDALVWDSTNPARFAVWEPLTKRTLMIPRAALREVTGRNWAAAGVVLDGGSGATQLLTDYLDLLANALPKLGPLAITAARNATLELLVGAIRPATLAQVGCAPGPALRAVMESWIERNLGSQEITPATIAAAHGVSVRTVHRIFGTAGASVATVVRLRRLARARGDLAVRAEPISVIARRWGFADSSHFTRAFHAHYGITPSDYRATQLA
jgi:AraC family transcriptional regulator, positive regulator of tynA and feaB